MEPEEIYTYRARDSESDRNTEIGREAERQWQSLGDRKRVGDRYRGTATKIQRQRETTAMTKTQRTERQADRRQRQRDKNSDRVQ